MMADLQPQEVLKLVTFVLRDIQTLSLSSQAFIGQRGAFSTSYSKCFHPFHINSCLIAFALLPSGASDETIH